MHLCRKYSFIPNSNSFMADLYCAVGLEDNLYSTTELL